MKITESEIRAFNKKVEHNYKQESELAVLAYCFLWVAIIFRVRIRKAYYSGNTSVFITNLWYLLKDDFKQKGFNGKNDYSYLDYGEKTFQDRFKLLWFIPFKLKDNWFSAYMWMLRNNVWNYKDTHAEEERGVYDYVLYIIFTLKKGTKKLQRKVETWAELMYTDSADNEVANRGDKFSFEHTIHGESEVYYRTHGGIVHGRYSKVYTWFKIPFTSYQIVKEIKRGTGGKTFVNRNKTKLIKSDNELG